MTLKKHISLFTYAFVTWAIFYIIGLPDYYQSWMFETKIIICILVTGLYFPVTSQSLKKFWNNGHHFKNSFWLALYLTLPLFIFDYLLLGIYKGLGIKFVFPYWYLTFFYFSFWVQFPLIGYRMSKKY